MMYSEGQLIDILTRSIYTFKPAKLPLKIHLSNTNEQPKKQQADGQVVTSWIDIAKDYCPQVLKVYPYVDYKQEYDQQVCLIQSQLRFDGSNQPGFKWTLLKSKQDVNEFSKKYRKIQPQKYSHKKQHKHDVFKILGDFAASENKNHVIFQQFLQQLVPKDKWDLKVLGQYRAKKVEPNSVTGCLMNSVCAPCRRSNHYFITITNQNIILSQETLLDGEIEQAIPYTNSLHIDYSVKQQTYLVKYVIGIRSGKTFILVAFKNLFDLLKFSYTYSQVKSISPYFEDLRFSSFSPQRQHNFTKFYSDSQNYFSDLHDEIELADKKICITGWCITPYFLLKRPQSIKNGSSRLDQTLLRAARRGVKIFIMVFQEPSLFVSNDSFNVWKIFQEMDQNFKVLRHPGLLIPQLWSHHQKCAIIDEKVAFMGGLDICYGRWDTHEHPLNDKDGLWQGADYNNERQRSITQPRRFQVSNLDRQNEPRMPWHDIAIQFRGPAIIDLQRHFVQYWYFSIRNLSDDPKDHIINFRTRFQQLMRQQKITRQQQQKTKQQRQQERIRLFGNPKPSQSQMQAVEYSYAIQKIKDQNDFTLEDRLKSAKQAFTDLIQARTARTSKQVLVEGFGFNSRPGNMRLQLCRSSCKWSTGIDKVQHSIYNAYLGLIKDSREFIYIENQFFMSHQNDISEELAARIFIAFQRKQKYKVIIMMPLLPGFQGDVTQQSAGILRVQMQIQYEAISRHKNSIFQILEKQGMSEEQVWEYISFFGVRNHGLFGKDRNIPKTQIIYVHSKLMIVDDRFMIIGSANINDRSLLGSRDSELAIVVEDPDGSMGRGSIFNFRCQIFKQHFGMSEGNCADVDSYWKKLKQFALKNTEIYRRVFGCYPDNTATKFSDVARIQKEADPKLYFELIRDLYGHYVEWPIYFLKDQNLSLKFGQKQFLAPITFFT